MEKGFFTLLRVKRVPHKKINECLGASSRSLPKADSKETGHIDKTWHYLIHRPVHLRLMIQVAYYAQYKNGKGHGVAEVWKVEGVSRKQKMSVIRDLEGRGLLKRIKSPPGKCVRVKLTKKAPLRIGAFDQNNEDRGYFRIHRGRVLRHLILCKDPLPLHMYVTLALYSQSETNGAWYAYCSRNHKWMHPGLTEAQSKRVLELLCKLGMVKKKTNSCGGTQFRNQWCLVGTECHESEVRLFHDEFVKGDDIDMLLPIVSDKKNGTPASRKRVHSSSKNGTPQKATLDPINIDDSDGSEKQTNHSNEESQPQNQKKKTTIYKKGLPVRKDSLKRKNNPPSEPGGKYFNFNFNKPEGYIVLTDTLLKDHVLPKLDFWDDLPASTQEALTTVYVNRFKTIGDDPDEFRKWKWRGNKQETKIWTDIYPEECAQDFIRKYPQALEDGINVMLAKGLHLPSPLAPSFRKALVKACVNECIEQIEGDEQVDALFDAREWRIGPDIDDFPRNGVTNDPELVLKWFRSKPEHLNNYPLVLKVVYRLWFYQKHTERKALLRLAIPFAKHDSGAAANRIVELGREDDDLNGESAFNRVESFEKSWINPKQSMCVEADDSNWSPLQADIIHYSQLDAKVFIDWILTGEGEEPWISQNNQRDDDEGSVSISDGSIGEPLHWLTLILEKGAGSSLEAFYQFVQKEGDVNWETQSTLWKKVLGGFCDSKEPLPRILSSVIKQALDHAVSNCFNRFSPPLQKAIKREVKKCCALLLAESPPFSHLNDTGPVSDDLAFALSRSGEVNVDRFEELYRIAKDQGPEYFQGNYFALAQFLAVRKPRLVVCLARLLEGKSESFKHVDFLASIPRKQLPGFIAAHQKVSNFYAEHKYLECEPRLDFPYLDLPPDISKSVSIVVVEVSERVN